MSKAAPMPLDTALKVVTFLRDECGLTDVANAAFYNLPGVDVVGSIRRECREVDDIDFIAPLPRESGTPWPKDPLWEALQARFGTEGSEYVITAGDATTKASLFYTPTAPVMGRVTKPIGDVIKGLRPRFKQATLSLKGKARSVKVEFYRYEPGPTGNKGWCELHRTGSADFAQAMLCKHIAMRGVRNTPECPGSRDGYLIGANNVPLPTPDEESVFHLVGMKPIAPKDRTDHTAKNIWDGIRRLT